MPNPRIVGRVGGPDGVEHLILDAIKSYFSKLGTSTFIILAITENEKLGKMSTHARTHTRIIIATYLFLFIYGG